MSRALTMTFLLVLAGAAQAQFRLPNLDVGRMVDSVKNVGKASKEINQEEEIAIGRDLAATLLGAAPLVSDARMQRYVAKLLDMTRLDAGGITVTIEPLDPADVAAAVATRAQNFTAVLDVEYRVRIETDPPGLHVRVEQSTVSSPATFYWPAGSRLLVEASSPQGENESRFAFSNWSDGGKRSVFIARFGDSQLARNTYITSTDFCSLAGL